MNIRENDEVRYWCEKIGCTMSELMDAIAVVGVMST
ncbi:DUF3606 domain-containing protein [Bradyrhizobium japonicum]